MDALEIADFLERQQTGVLSLASDDRGYGIPVSFAYEPESQHLYFRLGYTGDSQKKAFVDAADQASFVTYDRVSGGWKSVMAIGPLLEESETTIDSTVAEAVREVEIPYFSVHDRSSGDIEFHTTRLEPDSLTGIVEG